MKKLTTLLFFLVGCTHFSNVERVPGEMEAWRSLKVWDDGSAILIEETILGETRNCEILEVKRQYLDNKGKTTKLVVDIETCGVVDKRTSLIFDEAYDLVQYDVYYDDDHDGNFDRVYSKKIWTRTIN